jgi:hypothetical protein
MPLIKVFNFYIFKFIFNAKVGRANIFYPTTGNESLHEINNDNEVRGVKFATFKNLTVRSTMFPETTGKTKS